MDKYSWRIAIIVTVTFSVVGFILVKDLIHYIVNLPKDEVVCLDTRHMQELNGNDFDSARMTLVNSYVCKEKQTNKKDTAALWADAFVYAADYRGHYLKPDTIVILDTALMAEQPKEIAEYGFDPDDTIKRNIPKCRIVIPSDKIVSFRNYKYKYKEFICC